MRPMLLLALALVLASPLAAAEPDVRPLCDGKPLVDLQSCGGLYRVRTCGGDGPLGLFGVLCIA